MTGIAVILFYLCFYLSFPTLRWLLFLYGSDIFVFVTAINLFISQKLQNDFVHFVKAQEEIETINEVLEQGEGTTRL